MTQIISDDRFKGQKVCAYEIQPPAYAQAGEFIVLTLHTLTNTYPIAHLGFKINEVLVLCEM